MKHIITINKYDIIAITEVFPKYSIDLDYDSPEWCILGYNVYKPLKKIFTGRGCIIYTSEKLKTFQTEMLPVQHVEYVQIGIANNNKNILVSCIYRSPNAVHTDVITELKDILSTTKSNGRKFDVVLHMGDFNFKEINWVNETTNTTENHLSYKFLELTRDCFLCQHVKSPTRYRDGARPNTLDLIMTNEENMIDGVTHSAPLGKSDHEILEFQLITEYYISNSKTQVIKYNYSKGNYTKINTDLEKLNWEEEFRHDSVENAWMKFAEKVFKIIKDNIPVCNFRQSKCHMPWMKADVLKAVKKKRTLWKKYKYCKSTLNKDRYEEAKRLSSRKVRGAKLKYEKEVAENVKENPKIFWKFVNSKITVKETIPSLVDSDGKLFIDDEKKAVIE